MGLLQILLMSLNCCLSGLVDPFIFYIWVLDLHKNYNLFFVIIATKDSGDVSGSFPAVERLALFGPLPSALNFAFAFFALTARHLLFLSDFPLTTSNCSFALFRVIAAAISMFASFE
jgi:hypothetical protein